MSDEPITRAKIAAALAAAQSEMTGAAKDAKNPHFGNKYADLASVVDACRPLSKHGIAILQPTSADGNKVTVRTLLIHSSGEWVSSDLTMTAKDASPQAIGSAITYGRRYGLMAMVGIAPEDDDGEAAEGRGNGQQARQAVAPVSVPGGFGEWWADIQAVADEGTQALEAAWKKSRADLRKYVTEHHNAKWEQLKAKAAKVPAAVSA